MQVQNIQIAGLQTPAPLCVDYDAHLRHSLASIKKKVRQLSHLNGGKSDSRALKRSLSKIEAEELLAALEKEVQEGAEKGDIDKLLKQLADTIPLPLLEEAFKNTYTNYQDALQAAKKRVRQAEYSLKHSKSTKLSPWYKTKIKELLHALRALLENLIKAFGVTDLFSDAYNDLQASYKLQKIVMLATLLASIASLIAVTAVSSLYVGIAIAGAVALIGVAAVIYMKYLRPAPSELPCGENLTTQALNGKIPPLVGREKYMDQIARHLVAGKDIKRHPMLVGPSGVGKTEIARGFAQAVAAGKYPGLKGKRVFYFDTSKLVQRSYSGGTWWDGDIILEKISEAMGKYRDDVIVIFDELQYACKKGEDGYLGARLKPFLDRIQNGFPYVVGIATVKAYEEDIVNNDEAFDRRFLKIPVESASQEETVSIVNRKMLSETPETLLEAGAMEYLYKKSKEMFPNDPQPYSALCILARCRTHINGAQSSDLEEQIAQKTHKLDAVSAERAMGSVKSMLRSEESDSDEVSKLEQELEKLQRTLREHQAEMKKLSQMRTKISDGKKKMFQAVLKIRQFKTKHLSKSQEKQIKEFLLLSHVILPTLETVAERKAEKLGIKTAIDNGLIDICCQEEKAERDQLEAMKKSNKK